MLSTTLYSACTSMEIIMGIASESSSGFSGSVPMRAADTVLLISYTDASIALAACTISWAQASRPRAAFRHKS